MSRFAWALVFTALAVTRTARADDTSDLLGLLEQPVVQTASKTAETSSTAPAVSTTITAEELRRYGIRSLNEAINFLSLGMVTTNPLHAVEIGARGVLLTGDYGTHVALLVNGHVMNEPWNGTAYFERGAGIPFELIDHIEIILGPGSVLYGSAAMLGVINIITKRARDFAGVHVIAESELATSIRGAAGAGTEFTMLGRPGELSLEVEYYAQSGPDFTFGPQLYGADAVTGEPKRFSPDGPPTGIWGGTATRSYSSRVPSAYARLRLGDIEVTARASAYRRSTPYLDQIINNFGDFDDPSTYELDRFLALDIKHRKVLSRSFELGTRLYGDLYDYTGTNTSSAAEDCLPGQTRGCRRTLTGASQWAGAEIQGSIDWTEDSRFVTLVGADGRIQRVGSHTAILDRISEENPSLVGAFQESNATLALYLQQAARPAPWIRINAGVRADFYPTFGGTLSPRTAATVSPWRGGTLKAIYAEAFRAPSSYERLGADPSSQLAAPDLRPERVRSIEGSMEHRFGAQRLLFGMFRTFWSDLVLISPITPDEFAAATAGGQITAGASPGDIRRYKNVATIDHYGFNAAFEGSLLETRLRYGVQITGAYARRDESAGPLPLTVSPQLFGNARVSYDLSNDLPTLALAAQFLGERPTNRAFVGGFTPPPYAPPHLEMRATASGPLPWIRGLSYRVSANVAFAEKGPYVIGPIQSATPEEPDAELSPVDTFRAAVGLRYDL